MFIIECRKAQQCQIQELNFSFLFNLHQGMVANKHQYVTKMTLHVMIGGLWGDFITIFWIAEYLCLE
jgi:beta-lactamase superfamily II metal-dependent hydrolase